MHFKDYITGTVRRCLANTYHTDLDKDLVHGIIGLSTESAELLDLVKKYIFFGRPFTDEKVIDEMGDVAWYLALLCDHYGMTFEMLMDYNAKKLAERYKDKPTTYPEVNRQAEAQAQFGSVVDNGAFHFWGQ